MSLVKDPALNLIELSAENTSALPVLSQCTVTNTLFITAQFYCMGKYYWCVQEEFAFQHFVRGKQLWSRQLVAKPVATTSRKRYWFEGCFSDELLNLTHLCSSRAGVLSAPSHSLSEPFTWVGASLQDRTWHLALSNKNLPWFLSLFCLFAGGEWWLPDSFCPILPLPNLRSAKHNQCCFWAGGWVMQ